MISSAMRITVDLLNKHKEDVRKVSNVEFRLG